MLVKDLMTPDPIHVLPELSVAEAGSMMEARNIRHLPVMDEQGQVLGLVTRSSLDKALPGMGTGLTRFEVNYLTSSTKVSEVMIQEPLTIDQTGAVEAAARLMNENRISCLLVMDGEQLQGIITDTDLFEGMLRLLGARRTGVRLTVHIPDRPGQIARITQAIAELDGNVTALGGWYIDGVEGVYGAMFKIENVSQQQVVSAIEPLEDLEIVDIRANN